MNFFKLIWDFLRWLMSLPVWKIIVVILIGINIIQFYIGYQKEQKNNTNFNILSEKYDSCKNDNMHNERWWSMRTDSLVSVGSQKYEKLLEKIIEKAEKSENETKETNKTTEKIIKNLSKK